MANIGNNIIPNVPDVGTLFPGQVEHMDHHRKLEAGIETINVALTDVYTKPTLSITTTTAGALIIALAAAGLITTSA